MTKPAPVRRKRLPSLTTRRIRDRRIGKDVVIYYFGKYYGDDDKIVVDNRQRSRDRLDTVIHECVHREFRTWLERVRRGRTEAEVLNLMEEDLATRVARTASALLWREGWRRTETR